MTFLLTLRQATTGLKGVGETLKSLKYTNVRLLESRLSFNSVLSGNETGGQFCGFKTVKHSQGCRNNCLYCPFKIQENWGLEIISGLKNLRRFFHSFHSLVNSVQDPPQNKAGGSVRIRRIFHTDPDDQGSAGRNSL